jgi:hypothetical protein
MNITEYDDNEGDIIFLIGSERRKEILDKLRANKIVARCDNSDTSFCKIIAACSIEQLNQALEDLPD